MLMRRLSIDLEAHAIGSFGLDLEGSYDGQSCCLCHGYMAALTRGGMIKVLGQELQEVSTRATSTWSPSYD